jgi:hypothetical protein
MNDNYNCLSDRVCELHMENIKLTRDLQLSQKLFENHQKMMYTDFVKQQRKRGPKNP